MMKPYLAIFFSFIISGLAFTAESTASKSEEIVRSFESPVTGALELVYQPTAFQSYQWSNDETNSARINGFRINAEWIPFGDQPFGKPVIGIGAGYSGISKLGLNASSSGTLTVIPVEPYIGYRMDYFRNQVLVPYGKVGLGMAYLQEELQVPDGKRLSHRTYLGLDLSAGAELWLNFIDRKSGRSLDASTGINGVYLLVEYYKSRDLGAKYANLSREEVRMGMRFEF